MNAVVDPPSQADLKTLGCTHMRLRQLVRHVTHHYDFEMAKVGLKTTQYSLLSHVLQLGPVRPTELARAMQFGASTLTRNLKPLINAGWVELSAGADARSRSVTITEAGRVKRGEARHHWKAAQQSLNRLLGAERVLALHALIDESIELLADGDVGQPDR
ncbi:MAG TPA: MarR family winged helix-turn-helix transcriptional regulator [Rhodoferax sp.]|jgi:DNA-binding MarR family transcriptional regulator|nr:MarR family winged helix-turn-helix transcriptional regulator [Rhodoferax sp.]